MTVRAASLGAAVLFTAPALSEKPKPEPCPHGRFLAAAGNRLVTGGAPAHHSADLLHRPSMSGHRVPPTGGFYAPTKFAVRAVTDALRSELKSVGSKIQIGSVSPGFVDTPMLEQYFRGREETLTQTRAAMRMLDPYDVAWTILCILEAPPHVEIGDILVRGSGQQM